MIPAGTILLAEAPLKYAEAPIKTAVEFLKPGATIHSLDGWTEVTLVESVGTHAVDEITFEGGLTIQLTPEHCVFVIDEEGKEHVIEVLYLCAGQRMLAPTGVGGKMPFVAEFFRRLDDEVHQYRPRMVEKIERRAREVEVWDLQTQAHRVYLSDGDVLVSE